MKWTYTNSIKRFVGMTGAGLPDNGVTGDEAYIVDTQATYINCEDKWYNKADGKSAACDITKAVLTIDGENYNGIIDGLAIGFTVPYGTDVTELAPTITKSANSTISPTTAQDFSSPVTYTVTAYDGKMTKEYVISVTVEPEPEA